MTPSRQRAAVILVFTTLAMWPHALLAITVGSVVGSATGSAGSTTHAGSYQPPVLGHDADPAGTIGTEIVGAVCDGNALSLFNVVDAHIAAANNFYIAWGVQSQTCPLEGIGGSHNFNMSDLTTKEAACDRINAHANLTCSLTAQPGVMLLLTTFGSEIYDYEFTAGAIPGAPTTQNIVIPNGFDLGSINTFRLAIDGVVTSAPAGHFGGVGNDLNQLVAALESLSSAFHVSGTAGASNRTITLTAASDGGRVFSQTQLSVVSPAAYPRVELDLTDAQAADVLQVVIDAALFDINSGPWEYLSVSNVTTLASAIDGLPLVNASLTAGNNLVIRDDVQRYNPMAIELRVVPRTMVYTTPLDYTENDPATTVNASAYVQYPAAYALTRLRIRAYGAVDGVLEVLSVAAPIPAGVTSDWNAASHTLTLSGAMTVAEVSALMASVQYQHLGENPTEGQRVVNFEAFDGIHTGFSDNRAVNVIAVNDAPVALTSDASPAFVEDGIPAVADDSLTLWDDSGQLSGARVWISSGFEMGLDILAITSPDDDIAVEYGLVTGILTLSGQATVSQYEAALRSLTFAHTGQSPSSALRELSIIVVDAQDAESAVVAVDVAVTPVNDAPTLTAETDFELPDRLEDQTDPDGVHVAELLGDQAADVDDVDLGIAVIGFTSLNGSWEYAANDEAEWTAFEAATPESATVLAAEARLRFVPHPDESPSNSLDFVVWDASDGLSSGAAEVDTTLRGDQTPFSSDEGYAQLHVLSVNDPPSMTLGPDPRVSHNAGATVFEAWLVDPSPGPENEGDQRLTLSVDNDNPSLFASPPTISASGRLEFTPTLNLGGEATVTVALMDDGGVDNGGADTFSDTFTITVTGNTPPSFVPPTPQGPLEATEGQLLSFQVAAEDTELDAFTLAAQGLPAGAVFDASTGRFSWTPTFSDEGTHTLTFSARDASDLVATTTIVVNVSFLDGDDDGLPDAWEQLVGMDPTSIDSDGDTLSDGEEVRNWRAPTDTDGDGTYDALDDDSDDDDVLDSDEAGDDDPLTPAIDTDGDEIADFRDENSDNDAVDDVDDNCRLVVNDDQEDLDGDGRGDACDDDIDGDRVSNDDETQLGLDPFENDTDGDGISDGDEVGDVDDPLDTDEDGTPDYADDDSDGDSVADRDDNCPVVANPDQADSDANRVGDACDGDLDGDGVPDEADNCPLLSNADQADDDANEVGNVCDGASGDDAPVEEQVDGPADQVLDDGCGCRQGGGAHAPIWVCAFLMLLAVRRGSECSCSAGALD